jgi:hypothetical protein
VFGSSGSIAPIRSIHTAVLTSAIAAPPEAMALSAQSWLIYQLAPTKGLSIRPPQSAELLAAELLLETGFELELELIGKLLDELETGAELLETGIELELLDTGTELLDTGAELLELTGALLLDTPPPTMP